MQLPAKKSPNTKLRSRRKALGMTQGELAAEIGVSQATINQIEVGRNDPKISTARKIAIVLEVDASYFF